MQYKDLKKKAKELGLRVTKNVNGKRVRLTSAELRNKITTNFENSVKNAQRVIKICRTVVMPNQPRAPPPPPPPLMMKKAPPPPKKNAVPLPKKNSKAQLMNDLKIYMKKKGKWAN